MIARMLKYDFVLHARERQSFLTRLQELGLVDITVSAWEPDEEGRRLVAAVEGRRKAVEALRSRLADRTFRPGLPYLSGDEAFERYSEALSEENALKSEIVRLEKSIEELRPWGEFSAARLGRLEEQGVVLRFFVAFTNAYEKMRERWAAAYHIERIAEEEGRTYFVVLARPGEEVVLDAQELKAPTMSYREAEKELRRTEAQYDALHEIFARAAASVDEIEADADRLSEQLDLQRVTAGGGEEAADGSLVVMQGWAEDSAAPQVDRMLEDYPGLFYVKSSPTPDDNTPVKLNNRRFARLFELIGGFYALPRYGYMDLTPYFAPFYMIFFGFCLAEGGYGLLLLVAGAFMRFGRKRSLYQIGALTMLCGASAMIFGLLSGTFFGIQLAELPAFARMRSYFLTPDNLFTLALVLGGVQLIFGMTLKTITYTRLYGIRYALSTIGWMLLILSTAGAMFLPPEWGFTTHSVAYGVLAAVAAFMMFFLNSPGKNPLVNFGSGLWNLYNDVVALVGDLLSYIRLFAIGLSGGILAMVFNSLAFGLSPEIPVVRQIVIVLILLVGHGINLFMSSLSSFVHPMRLTFVEFYKNAGFEAATREFRPLARKHKPTTNQ